MKQTTKQYLKYKDKFKQQGVVGILSSACMLLTLILFVFVPCFKINLAEDLNIEGLSYSFSLFDEIALSFSHLSDMNLQDPQGAVMFVMSLYQIMAIVFIGMGGFALARDLITSVMNTMNLDDYALTEYDNIKSKREQGVGRAFKRANSTVFFVTGIVWEIFAIVISKGMLSSDKVLELWETPLSYFVYMNTVTGGFYVVIILVLFSLGLSITKSRLAKEIKMQILKEDYNLPERNEQADEIEKKDDGGNSSDQQE